METILYHISHSPKASGWVSLVLLIIAFFVDFIHFLGPDWIIIGLKIVSLLMVIFINYPAFKKRVSALYNQYFKSN